jgi:dTDP-4-amino-4,6-dideoxygalactose transaminase
LVTNEESVVDQIQKYRNHGLASRDQCDFWGFNCRLDELQAGVLRIMLPKLDQWIEQRRRLAGRYNEKLAPFVKVPIERDGEYHAYQTYVVQAERRDELQQYLRQNGVEALVHYPVPIHCQPASAELGYGPEDFPVTMATSQRILSLPLYPEMEDRQHDHVVDMIAEFYK